MFVRKISSFFHDEKERNEITEKIRLQLSPSYQKFRIIFHSDPDSFFYALANLYETELRQQERTIACGRIWNLATKWKNHDESVSQDEEDYDEYEPVPVFRGEEDYDEYEYDEFNSPRTILEMAASHLLHDSQKDYNHLIYSDDFHFYIGDHIMAYYLDDIHGHIHCLAKPKVRADDVYRPHSTNSPSISWKWTKIHCLYGVYFDEKLFYEIVDRKLDGKKIISITNMEQRRVAMDIYGIEKLMESLDKKLIDKSSRGNELYRINLGYSSNSIQISRRMSEWAPNTEQITGLVLKYSCPSTGRIYFSGIPEVDDNEQRIKSADQAMAWKFGLSEEEYSMLTIET